MGRTGQERVNLLENFTRVEGFGQPNHHWLRITVDDSEGVFTVRQRIVPANIVKR